MEELTKDTGMVYTIGQKGRGEEIMPVSEALKRAQRKYDAEKTYSVHLKFNLETEDDVIRRLKSMPNKNGYIKELIRKDMMSGQK